MERWVPIGFIKLGPMPTLQTGKSIIVSNYVVANK